MTFQRTWGTSNLNVSVKSTIHRNDLHVTVSFLTKQSSKDLQRVTMLYCFLLLVSRRFSQILKRQTSLNHLCQVPVMFVFIKAAWITAANQEGACGINAAYVLIPRRRGPWSTTPTSPFKCWKTGGMWTWTASPSRHFTPWRTRKRSTDSLLSTVGPRMYADRSQHTPHTQTTLRGGQAFPRPAAPQHQWLRAKG